MQVYLDLVILLNFLVDLLLILAANRLCGYPLQLRRCAAGALLGGLYAGICMIPGWSFLGNALWRAVFLCLISVISFGANRSALRRGALLIFLSMALGGIAVCIGRSGFWGIVLSAAVILAMCAAGFSGKAAGTCVPVELYRNGQKYSFTALHDTGNLLRDPVTGQRVLVAGPEIAWDIFGFTQNQLSDPVGTMEQERIPGLRLIPYRCVGQSGAMLLAVSFEKVCIAGVERGSLVAFSPNQLGANGTYQALTGGEI